MNAVQLASNARAERFDFVEYINSLGALSIIRFNGSNEIKFCMDSDMSQVVVTRGVTRQGQDIITFSRGVFNRSIVSDRNRSLAGEWAAISDLIMRHEHKDDHQFELKFAVTAMSFLTIIVFAILLSATILVPKPAETNFGHFEIAHSKAAASILKEIHVID